MPAVRKKPAARGRPRDRTLPARRREEILCAATLLFAGKGYAAADLQGVADRLGVAKGTLYRYFKSKRAVFLAAVDRGMRMLGVAIDESSQHEADPLRRIRLSIEAYLRFFREYPELCELIIIERAEFRDRRTPTYFRHREANRTKWRAFYGALMQEGLLRTVPVDDLLGVIGNVVYGTMFTDFFTGSERTPEEQAAAITEVLFRGILTTEGERRWAASEHE